MPNARPASPRPADDRTQVPGPPRPAATSRVAIVIPCLNEERTIASVVEDFAREVPGARIVVIDNASRDRTADLAAAAGAIVVRENRAGKGHAVRRALRSIDADVYLLVDGDGTYPAADAPRLIQPVLDDDADVVIGGRLEDTASEFKVLNRLGNWLFLWLVNVIFRTRVFDLLTGYRAMSREFVRRAPVLSTGFELETELTILALERGFRMVQVPIRLAGRPTGSHSKLRMFRDGFRILGAIFTLLRDYRPLTFFGGAGLLAAVAGLGPGLFVTWEFTRTGFVRVPTALLAVGLEVIAVLLGVTGILLTTLARRFREIDHHLAGLEIEIWRASAAAAGGERSPDRRS